MMLAPRRHCCIGVMAERLPKGRGHSRLEDLVLDRRFHAEA
jgi:hypothetical protein